MRLSVRTAEIDKSVSFDMRADMMKALVACVEDEVNDS